VAVCFAPMLAVVPQQVSSHTQTITEEVDFATGLKHTFWNMQQYLLNATPTPLRSPGKWLWWAIDLTVAIAALGRFRSFLLPKNAAIWTGTAVSALIFGGLVMLTGMELLLLRHTAVLFLPAFLSLYVAAFAVAGRVSVATLTVLVIAFNAVSLPATYHRQAKGGDWKRVARFLMEHEKPGQPIVVFLPSSALPLARYYRGVNKIVPIPRAEKCESYDLNDYVLSDEQELEKTVNRLLPNHQTLWLVTNGPQSYLGVKFHGEVLEQYVAGHYQSELEVEFYGTEVRLLAHAQQRVTAVTSHRQSPPISNQRPRHSKRHIDELPAQIDPRRPRRPDGPDSGMGVVTSLTSNLPRERG